MSVVRYIRNYKEFYVFFSSFRLIPVFRSTFSDFIIHRPGLSPEFCLPFDLYGGGGGVAPPPLKPPLLLTTFAAALTKVPTAPELHIGVPKVLSVHSIGNLNSTPPFSFNLGNDFSDPTTWFSWLMGTFKGPSKCQYKIKISRETFGYLSKERGFFAMAWPLLLCVLFSHQFVW